MDSRRARPGVEASRQKGGWLTLALATEELIGKVARWR